MQVRVGGCPTSVGGATPAGAHLFAREVMVDFIRDLAAERPLVLVLDNLHLADSLSVAAVVALRRRLGFERVALTAALCPDPTRPELDALVAPAIEVGVRRVRLAAPAPRPSMELQNTTQKRRTSSTLYAKALELLEGAPTIAADRFLGMVADIMGEVGVAEQHIRLALNLDRQLESVPLLARTNQWYAQFLEAHDRPGDSKRAAELAETALAIAERLGVSVVAGSAGAVLGHFELAGRVAPVSPSPTRSAENPPRLVTP